MKTLLFIAAFNAVFFALILYQKRQKSLHDKILFWWLMYLALYTSLYAFTSEYIFTDFPLLSGSLMSLFLLHGPSLYLYIKPLATNIKRLGLKEWLHFIPFIAFNLYLAIASQNTSLAQGISFAHVHHDGGAPLLFNIFLILTALSGPIYFVVSYRMLGFVNAKLQQNYSFSKEVDVVWLRKLVIIFGIIWTVLICIAVVHHVFNYFSLFFCTNGLSLSLSAFIILTGYFGLKQRSILTSEETQVIDKEEPTREKYSRSGMDKADVDELAKRLTVFMLDKKPYLDPELTLSKLALQLGIPSHHLSRVINESFDTNFFDFVNHYRINEVKLRITDPEYHHLSILGIALDCGFNSKSAFNRLFKKYTGLTPSDFKNGISSNSESHLVV